jgi:hypothetical protein
MSDQADGLRQWMKRSRAASVARDAGGVRRRPHEPIPGRGIGETALETSGVPVQAPTVVDPGAADADRTGGSHEEAVLM